MAKCWRENVGNQVEAANLWKAVILLDNTLRTIRKLLKD